MTDFFDKAIEDMKEAEIEDESDLAGEEWEPSQAGQALRGYFSKAVPKATQYGYGYTVVVKDHDTNQFVKVWCKRKMLLEQLLLASPRVGAPIVFVYNGEKEGYRNPYHSYQVRADQSDPELWKQLEAKARAAQEAFDRGSAPRTVGEAIAADTEVPY